MKKIRIHFTFNPFLYCTSKTRNPGLGYPFRHYVAVWHARTFGQMLLNDEKIDRLAFDAFANCSVWNGMYGLHARDKQTTICYLNDILGTSPRPTDLMLVYTIVWSTNKNDIHTQRFYKEKCELYSCLLFRRTEL